MRPCICCNMPAAAQQYKPCNAKICCAAFDWQCCLPLSRLQLAAIERTHTHAVLLLPLQAWRCAQARALLPKLRAELPRLRAQRAWQNAVGLVQAAQRRQRLEAARREVAVLALQSAVRGWLVRREVSKQLAGIRRFQVGAAGTAEVFCWRCQQGLLA